MKAMYASFSCLLISVLVSPAMAGDFFRYHSDVPGDQKTIIEQDLLSLSNMGTLPMTDEQKQIMGVTDSSAQTLLAWVKARVNYILPQSFELQQHIFVAQAGATFANTNLPTVESPTAIPTNTSVKVVMSNIGGAIYFAGKSNNVVLGMDLGSLGKVPVSSPRVGLLKVGEGLFSSISKLAAVGPNSPARRAFRLSTLFHEARHSDGNGESLGFLHAVCPAGHDYAGYNACDRSSNGPYTIDAILDESLKQACTDCNPAEQEALTVLAADSYSRVIPPIANNAQMDAIKAILNLCDMVKKMNIDPNTIKGCSDAEVAASRKLMADSATGTAGPWDATPEQVQ